VSRELLQTAIQGIKEWRERFTKDATDFAIKLADKLTQYKHCAEVKLAKVQARHAAMDKAIEAGIKEEAALYRFMLEYHSELMRMGKKKYVSAASMMKQFRRARRHDCQ
jgi:hypothetical protein